MTNKRVYKTIREVYLILAREDHKPTKACIDRILKQIRHNGFVPEERTDEGNNGYIIFNDGSTVHQLAYIKGYAFYDHGFVAYKAD